MDNKGKKFEQIFRQDWSKTFPNSFLYRLQDQLSGYKVTSQNVSDYIGFTNGFLFLLEDKTHAGASIPFDCITQYERMLKYVGIPGLRAGCIIWLYDKDVVLYVPISTIKKMKEDGEKSVGIRHLGKYNIYQIPSEKKRVFMQSDYSLLLNLNDGE